jgi:hypothetical protein
VTVYEKANEILGRTGEEVPPTLTELVFDVRASTNGAAEPMTRQALAALRAVFEMRLAEWTQPEDEIDRCVKSMCEEAIILIDVELRDRTQRGWDY